MKTRTSKTIHRMSIEPDEEIKIHAGGEFGPENVVTVDEYGMVTIECEYRKITICSVDPGPGGIDFYVEGKHEDGCP